MFCGINKKQKLKSWIPEGKQISVLAFLQEGISQRAAVAGNQITAEACYLITNRPLALVPIAQEAII
jgi:hypothetical protein